MIGLDTVFFTREGFKKLRELNLYDEVLTPLGMFQPIMKMSKIEDVDYYIKTSTDEIIKCSSDMMLPLYNENHTERMVCVSCIKDKKYYTLTSNGYLLATNVIKLIDNWYTIEKNKYFCKENHRDQVRCGCETGGKEDNEADGTGYQFLTFRDRSSGNFCDLCILIFK